MKVVILHQHFKDPRKGGAIRSYYLAKALADRKIGVRVVTIHNERNYKSEMLEGIEVHYLPIAYDNRFGFVARVRSFIGYVWAVMRRPDLLKDADLCYVISTPLTTGIAGVWIKKRYGIPYIFEVGDLWPDAPVEMGFIQNPVLKWMLFRLEKYIYRQADAVVALSVPIRNSVLQKAPGKKVHLIPNMADTDFYFPEPKNDQLAESLKVKGKFVVSYVGAVGFANGLDYFVECARASQRADLPVHFILCGEGGMLEGLKKSVKQLGLQNFSFVSFQNRDGVKNILSITDASFISYRPFRILETGSPNKYFDALAAGKLVIVNFGGWIREEIERNQCGFYVDSKHPTDFVKKIMPFTEDNGKVKAYQVAARQLAEREYARRILGERFVGILGK